MSFIIAIYIYLYNSKPKSPKLRGKNKRGTCLKQPDDILVPRSASQINQALQAREQQLLQIEKDGPVASIQRCTRSAHAPHMLTTGEQRHPATPGSGRKRKVGDMHIFSTCYPYANDINSVGQLLGLLHPHLLLLLLAVSYP